MVFERIISIHLREPSAQCASLQRAFGIERLSSGHRAQELRALSWRPHAHFKDPSFKDNLTRIYTDFGTSFLPPHFPFGHAPASTASDGTQARGEIDSTMNWRIGGVPLEATPPLA